MTKIFEALEQARKERGEAAPETSRDSAAPDVEVEARPQESLGGEEPASQRVDAEGALVRLPEMLPERSRAGVPARRQGLPLEEKMAGLFRSLTTLLPESTGMVVQFMSCRKGEGASALAREMAKVVAQSLDKSVLLLDADPLEPSQAQAFKVQPSHGWEEAISRGTPLRETIYQVGEGNLYVGQMSVESKPRGRVSDLPQLAEFFEDLKQRFDLVIVDSPAATTSSEGLALSRRADGVLLVIEAEKTRRQVADRVRDKIEDHGGRILGAVLNKRKFPIPDFIYRRL